MISLVRSTPTILKNLLFLFILVACSPTYKQPTVIHHAMPNLKVSTDWVETAGCHLNATSPERYSGSCTSESPLLKMGCERIEVSYLFGGLSFPVVTCANSDLELLGTDYAQVGCMFQQTEAFLTLKDGNYQFVGTDEIKAMSVPIDSPDEALSYALVTTDYYAAYDFIINSYREFLVDKIEDTFVEEVPNGYIVHLFSNQEPQCGCGTHYTNSVAVLVYKNGNIKKINSHHVYKYDACVD